MRQRLNLLFILAFGAVMALSVPAVFAQDNALRDPGFEGTYTGRGRPDLNIPADWGLWISESPRTETWMNLAPVAFPHRGPDPSPHSGTLALNFNKGYATFTAAVYQQVNVEVGTNITGSAWGLVQTCDIPQNADRCTSEPGSGAFMRVGIDPNGGTNPYDSDVVWSPNTSPHGGWQQMTVSATTTGPTATLFLFTTQAWPRQLNNAYWDDASVTGGGVGGAAPINTTPGAPVPTVAPTAPPFVNFVSPQAPQSDGSIVHTVQAGDTVDSIAFAYGVSRSQIMELNNMRDARIIQIGQQLIISESQGEATPEVTAPPETEPQTGPPVGSGARPTTALVPTSSALLTQIAAAPTLAPVVQPGAEITQEVISTEDPVEGEFNEDGSTNFGPTNPTPTRFPYGFSQGAEAAPVVSVASGEVVPALDPNALVASVCVILFEDLNANRIQEEGELALDGGVIRLLSAGAEVASLGSDDSGDPRCFDDVQPGEYIAAASAPDGYGLTTADQYRVSASAGIRVNLAFGAAEGVLPAQPPPADDGGIVNEVAGEETDTTSPNTLEDNVGYLMFGAAGLVVSIGFVMSILMRRR